MIVIDAGNTHLRYAVIENDTSKSLEIKLIEWEELPSVVGKLFSLYGNDCHFAISSVVDHAKERITEVLNSAGHFGALLFCNLSESTLLQNHYATTLGIDRYVDAVAAHTRFPERNLIVIDSGTATTVDFVRKDGAFLGGYILPGIGLKARVIGEKTDRLPLIDPYSLSLTCPPCTTVDAVASGLLLDCAGGIEKAIGEGQKILESPIVVACGGGWKIIGPYVSELVIDMPDLTLYGTALVGYELLKKRETA